MKKIIIVFGVAVSLSNGAQGAATQQQCAEAYQGLQSAVDNAAEAQLDWDTINNQPPFNGTNAEAKKLMDDSNKALRNMILKQEALRDTIKGLDVMGCVPAEMREQTAAKIKEIDGAIKKNMESFGWELLLK